MTIDDGPTPTTYKRKDSLEFRKLDVTVRDTDYTAGKKNLTAIVIRNTYPVSVGLISVTASHSALNTATGSSIHKGSVRRPPRPSNTRVKIIIPNPLKSFFSGSKYDKPLLEIFHSTSNIVESEPLTINADKGAIITVDENAHVSREVLINAKEGAIINFEGNVDADLKKNASPILVSSMSEIVSEYFWETKGWLLFIPSRIGIDIEIKYSIGDEARSQVVSTTFDVKPPVYSIILGGIAGGLIGNLARAFTEHNGFYPLAPFFVKLAGTCLLSIMAVIFLSRKSGPQSFITVEDFFGAFVLGSLIGYEGTSFFEKNVINGPTGERATLPPSSSK